jgi:class 3 adenylate cyclase/tetratricopeptide (TPR) repeat protein
VNCSSCGFPNAVIARFCGGCGKTLGTPTVSAQTGQRRQLTALMIDIVDSTALADGLDPEDLHNLLGDYRKVCSDAVKRHDGHFAQVQGDGVVLYFGFPRAHEDDARRALRCGLDILVDMRTLNRSAVRPLAVRLGAHTGRVVVAAVGIGDREEMLAEGDVLNIAFRVQSIGAPDTLVVSDATWRIVQSYFRAEPLGERVLRGVANPMRLWRVTAVTGAESRLEGGSARTPFVGREQERAALEAHWAIARSGAARFVTVRGEAGIGKSRLIEEFVADAGVSGVDVLTLRCTPYAQNSAFLPVIEMIVRRNGLDPALASVDQRLDRLEARMAELEVTGPDVGPLMAGLLSIPTGERYPPLALSPVRQRVRTLEILVAALQAIARRPTLLVAEDLHWSDPSTLEYLQLAMTSPSPPALLALYSGRPEFQPPWAASDVAPMIDLNRLDHREVEALVRHVAHGKAIPGEVMRELSQRCDGVPLYIEEMARAVIETGALEEREYSWELTRPLPTGLIPASVDASLMARIDRLGDARATAQLAATIGREFSYPLLRKVSDRSDEELREDLQQLVAAGLAWRLAGGDVFTFKHALVQAAAYESLLRSTRQRFHERIADVLRADFPDEVEHQPEVVARHLSGAGSHAQASDYWLAAGNNALARLAIPEANGHFARGLDDLKRVPESTEILTKELELQIAIAPTLMTVNGWASPTVAEACERARELCHRLSRPDRLYPPVWGLWTNLFVGGQLDRALVTANEALGMAQASGIPMLEVTGRHAVAYTRYYRGEWAEAITHARAGIALFSVEQEQQLTAVFQLSSTVNLVAALGSGLWMMGHQDDGLVELEHMLAIARDVRHPSALSNALGVACYMLTFHHDHALMLRYADEVKSFAREEGWELWYAVGVMSSGWSRLVLGDRVDGLRELFEGVALFRATRSDLMGPTVAVIHAEGLRAAGRPAEALAMLRAAAQTAREGHVGVLLPDVYRLIGELHFEAGELAEAEGALEQALEIARAQDALSLELRAALAMYPLLARTGRHDEGIERVRSRYVRFENSFDQPDLVRARTLLEESAQYS